MRHALLFMLLVGHASNAFSAQPLIEGERLSSWLLRQTPAVAYPVGLSWQVPQEKPAQVVLKQHLLRVLSLHTGLATPPALGLWLNKQAVTGRVVLANVDPRWLEVHPQQDPILAADQALIAVARPTTVAVLRRDGRLCQAQHTIGVLHFLSLKFS